MHLEASCFGKRFQILLCDISIRKEMVGFFTWVCCCQTYTRILFLMRGIQCLRMLFRLVVMEMPSWCLNSGIKAVIVSVLWELTWISFWSCIQLLLFITLLCDQYHDFVLFYLLKNEARIVLCTGFETAVNKCKISTPRDLTNTDLFRRVFHVILSEVL